MPLAGVTARPTTLTEAKGLIQDVGDQKAVIAERTLELRLLKKHDLERGRRGLRYSASEKIESIQLVERSRFIVFPKPFRFLS